jgi:hypothetical protein
MLFFILYPPLRYSVQYPVPEPLGSDGTGDEGAGDVEGADGDDPGADSPSGKVMFAPDPGAATGAEDDDPGAIV